MINKLDVDILGVEEVPMMMHLQPYYQNYLIAVLLFPTGGPILLTRPIQRIHHKRPGLFMIIPPLP